MKIHKNTKPRMVVPFLLGLFLIGLVVRGEAQVCPLNLSITYAPVQQLTIHDVDLKNFESHTLLFTLRIVNDTDVAVTTKLRINLNIRLANGESYPDAFTYLSQDFNVPHGIFTITNLDFGKSGKIQTEESNLSDEAKTNVEDVALATGKFPPGRYTYYFSLENTRCGTVDADEPVILIIENPTRVELISPRDGETTNEFPLFQFAHDGNRAVLTVAEQRADQSRDDAIDRQPPMISIELVGQNSFLYSGGRPLEKGKTYVWRVMSMITGPGLKDVGTSSVINSFTVSESTEPSDLESGKDVVTHTDDEIYALLKELCGEANKPYLESLRESGLLFTAFSLNGQSMSRAEVSAMLQSLIASQVECKLKFE
jgi:hypothetical protein